MAVFPGRGDPWDRPGHGQRARACPAAALIWSAGSTRSTMFAMRSSNSSGVPADVAAVRSEIETEIQGSTLLTAYAETAAQVPDVTAHRWLAGGQWQSLTYRQVRERVRDAALGLAAAGLRPGEFAAVWSRNRSEATIADYAVMHARGVPVFIYPTVSAEQAADLIGHCEATVVLIEREFVPVLNSIRAGLPRLHTVVVLDDDPAGEPAGAAGDRAEAAGDRAEAAGDRAEAAGDRAEADAAPSGAAGPRALRWTALLEQGRAEAERDPGAFERSWRQVTPDSLATLIYTSGTTGRPKGVMITHRNVRYAQQATLRVIPLADQVTEDGVATLVSYLPMAHVTGRSTDHWAPMALPVTVAYCPDQLRLFDIAALAHPTVLIGIPRVWEKLYAALRGALPDVTPAAVSGLPEAVRAAVRIRIGLGQCRVAISGAAPIDPEIVAFYRALGVPLTEGWGMSELCNAATLAAPARARTGAVGQAFPGVEVRTAGDREILVRGPLVICGYYKDPGLTTATLDAEGWLHTGDIGELDEDGFLRIVDRKKELIITSGGKNVSPAQVEYELQRHPLIGQACAIGDRRNYVTALLVLDPETSAGWARDRGIAFESVAELAAHPAVLAEVGNGVAAANAHLARPEQIRRYAVLPAEWTAQSGELTPSLKRRRAVIIDRYARQIEELYA
jgi:long-chain acyl-CoA synthetase